MQHNYLEYKALDHEYDLFTYYSYSSQDKHNG